MESIHYLASGSLERRTIFVVPLFLFRRHKPVISHLFSTEEIPIKGCIEHMNLPLSVLMFIS